MTKDQDGTQPDDTSREQPPDRWSRWQERAPLILSTTVLGIGLILILTLSFTPGPAPLRVGDVAKQNIRAQRQVSYISQIKTREARDAAAKSVPDVYDYDPAVAPQIHAQAKILFNGVANIYADANTTPEQKHDRIQRLTDGIVSPTTAKAILAVDELSWPAVVTECTRVIDDIMRDRVRPTELPSIKAKLALRFSQDLTTEQVQAAAGIVGDLLKPNELYNATETARQKREAQDKVEPVREVVEKDEIVVREGDVVSALDLEKLEALGIQQASHDTLDIASAVLLAIILVLTLGWYTAHSQKKTLADYRRWLFLIAGILLFAFVGRLGASDRIVEGVSWGYLVPFAVLPMLVGMLLDQQLAVVIAILVGILYGYSSGRSLDACAMVMLGGIVGALVTRQIERLSAFLWAGVFVALTNLAVVFVFVVPSRQLDTNSLLAAGILALINGGLAAAITAITFSPLGNALGATTVLHLLELAHPSQPLFRRLLLEAPGTYHHSVIIGTLAERAAERIGADHHLVRVAAYYHDIGKIVRPLFFIENQANGVNIHDTLDPKTSAKAVMAHVTDGLELARKHGLPKRIQDMIPQHHGTKLVAYFYARARESNGDSVNEDEFRYPGPKPQSREAGILMLADGVEAAVRASRDRSPEVIERIVCDIISAHVVDGQLNECDLTLKDLEQIRLSFTTVLQGVYHPRIEYPAIPKTTSATRNAVVSLPSVAMPQPPKARRKEKG